MFFHGSRGKYEGLHNCGSTSTVGSSQDLHHVGCILPGVDIGDARSDLEHVVHVHADTPSPACGEGYEVVIALERIEVDLPVFLFAVNQRHFGDALGD